MKFYYTHKLFFFFVVVFLSKESLGQTNNYFGTSGTLNGNFWSTDPAGPYTSALNTVGGAIINFGNNATITGATIPLAGINATANVTFTNGGTITNYNNGVITISVANNVTLDFSNQNFTTSNTAGYIKTGGGVLAIQGDSYKGGFTLNEGIVIVRGVNAMGSGGTLTINGGTIAANATRDLSGRYALGITIGGDFTLGATTGLASATANITFSDNTSLGTSTNRGITIGGNGTYTFSGPISGNGSNLNINATGTGILVLSGANSYTGTTTISSGTLRLARTGGATLPITNNAIVNGGILEIATDQTLNNLTIASGATLSVANGATLIINGVLDLGTTAGISGAGSLILSSGATLKTANPSGILGSIAVSGTKTFTAGANYEFNGTTTTAFPTTAQISSFGNPANVTVNSDITLNRSITVTGTLALNSGKITLGANDLTLTGTVTGPSFGSNSPPGYVIADETFGSGKFIRSSGLFPIGTTTSFLPVVITGGVGPFSVNLDPPATGINSNGILDYQWDISGGGSPNMSFQWTVAEENTGWPTSGNISLYKYGSSWEVIGSAPVPTGSPRTVTFNNVICCSGFTMGAEGLLPVELTSFNATLVNKSVKLDWQTATELNNDYFAVEKSLDGKSFKEIGRINGAGTSLELRDYRYTDHEIAAGINYYRLRQVDFNGTKEYSKVVSVSFEGGNKTTVFPTIFSEEIRIRFAEANTQFTYVELTELTGRIVYRSIVEPDTRELTIATASVVSGAYYIRLINGREIETIKVLKL